MSVSRALRAELERLSARDQQLADGALAATVLAMAEQLDDTDVSATAKASCARVLVDGLAVLRGLAPVDAKGDGLDDLAARRASRRGADTQAGARAGARK